MSVRIDGRDQVNENYRFVEHADLDMEPKAEGIVVERSISSPTSSLAAKAIRASSAHRDSSLSSAYSSPSSAPPKELKPHEFASTKGLNDPKRSLWGTLARKAKAIFDDDGVDQLSRSPARTNQSAPSLTPGTKKGIETGRKIESPSLQRSVDAITSSLNYIGGTIGSVFEEGFTAVENHTAGIIQETRRHIKKKPSSSGTRVARNEAVKQPQMLNQQKPQLQADLEIQLKASRDVAMAMAAKAKLLLRELKTVKADLAFAKQRCTQLEEENKVLREGRSRGDNPDDDDLIRLQLETLLAEKARLAHENSIYARENRFLREVVEYHQLTMQDVVYLDEKTEEVTEVYPIRVATMSDNTSFAGTPNFSHHSSPPPGITEIPRTRSCDSSNSPPPDVTRGAKMRF